MRNGLPQHKEQVKLNLRPSIAYYNEHDPKTAAWLRQLIKDGHLPEGTVDERDIQEVRAAGLSGHVEHHFFAGIGGWPLALRMAGWPAGRPVWTGSCPCQPFSVAGKRKAESDERHLWPDFFRLIRECRPPVVFGEQVASSDAKRWMESVKKDLECEGYAVAHTPLRAADFGFCHIRKRIYWVAADPMRVRGPRLGEAACASKVRQGRTIGPEDLLNLRPFDSGPGWPKPLLCAGDHGLPARVAGLSGAGNAIVPQVAAAFVRAFLEAEGGMS